MRHLDTAGLSRSVWQLVSLGARSIALYYRLSTFFASADTAHVHIHTARTHTNKPHTEQTHSTARARQKTARRSTCKQSRGLFITKGVRGSLFVSEGAFSRRPSAAHGAHSRQRPSQSLTSAALERTTRRRATRRSHRSSTTVPTHGTHGRCLLCGAVWCVTAATADH